MNMDDQVSALKKTYRDEIERVYDKTFQMRLMSVQMFDSNSYTRLMKTVETSASLIEGAAFDCNPKRMLRYLIVLKYSIDDLIDKTEKDYKKFWDNKLTH
jgi:hypothetical protein